MHPKLSMERSRAGDGRVRRIRKELMSAASVAGVLAFEAKIRRRSCDGMAVGADSEVGIPWAER
jgi:hypothetical protein